MKSKLKRILVLALSAALLLPLIHTASAYENNSENVSGRTLAMVMEEPVTGAAGRRSATPVSTSGGLCEIGLVGCTLLSDAVEQIPHSGTFIVDKAMEYLGCRYIYGGTSPRGFDCSGFVYFIYKQFGYNLKPGADNQWNTIGNYVSRDELLPGDLIFFSSNGSYSGINHIGIYIGDNQIIHASTPSTGVIISSLSNTWYANRYYGAQRVFA